MAMTAAGMTLAAICGGDFVDNVAKLKTIHPQASNCTATMANK